MRVRVSDAWRRSIAFWRRVGLTDRQAAMSATAGSDELQLVRDERDLYLQLLNLGRQVDLTRFLQEALGLIVGITKAVQGYLALFDDDDAADAPRWWIA